MKASNIILIVLIVVSAILAGLLVSSQNKLGNHDSIVKDYEDRIAQLEVEHNNMFDEKENLLQTIADLQLKDEKNQLLVEKLNELAKITQSKKQMASNVELGPDYIVDQSLETLQKNQKELSSLRTERGRLYAEINSLKDALNSSNADKEKIQAQINRVQAELDATDVLIANYEQSIKKNQELITQQEKEINTIYYVIGKKSELREMGITSKEGGVLWGLLGSVETLKSDFKRDQFTAKNLAENDEIEIKAYKDDITIHTKQPKSAYELVEVSKDITVLKVKNHEQFRKDKHVVIEIN